MSSANVPVAAAFVANLHTYQGIQTKFRAKTNPYDVLCIYVPTPHLLLFSVEF